MESPEEDIKPVIPTDDIPDKSLPKVPGVGKLKQSRYEDVWPEDVHAAFMEGPFTSPLVIYQSAITTSRRPVPTDG